MSDIIARGMANSIGRIPNTQTWIATEGQTVFLLGNGSYIPNRNLMTVIIDSVHQISGENYTETNSTSFTLTTPLPAGTKVYAKWYEVKVPETVGHGSRHEYGGSDEIDITKLKNYDVISEQLDETVKKTGGLSDPREYGAVGDGVADDTVALQAWLNATGKNRVLRNGIFRITAGLTSSVAGRTIKTDGAVILADTSDITVLTVSGDKNRIFVEIDGNSKAAIGVSVTGSGCEVKKCKIDNLLGTTINGIGIRAETSGGVRIEGNTITNVSATTNSTLGDNAGSARAILVTSTTASSALNIVKNNTIAGVTGEEGDAIQFLFYDGATLPFLNAQGIIQGNTIKNCNRRAIKIQGSNVKVIGNTHINTLLLSDVPNANSIINVIQSNDVIVQDNIMDASLFIGISVSGTSGAIVNRCTIKGNTIKSDTTKIGIYFDYLADSQIEGNTIFEGSTGISGSNSNSLSVSENTLYGGTSTTSGYAMNFVSNNSALVIRGNKSPKGQRQYMINNASPDTLVQDNYGNLGAGLIQTSSTATGSCYKNNVNAAATAPVVGTTTGQLLDGNVNM